MKVERLRVGDAVTVLNAAGTAPFLPTAYADVSAWQQGETGDKDQAYPYAEIEITGSTTIALTVTRLYGMVLDSLTVASATFTTTHASEYINDTSHGLLTGDGPLRLSNSGGALPAELSTTTDYYVIRVDADTFQLATSRANAFAGTAVAFTDDGTGTHSYVGYTTGTTKCQRVNFPSIGLLGDAGDGAITLGTQRGYIQRFSHSARFVGYALSATIDTGNITAKVRPVWFRE